MLIFGERLGGKADDASEFCNPCNFFWAADFAKSRRLLEVNFPCKRIRFLYCLQGCIRREKERIHLAETIANLFCKCLDLLRVDEDSSRGGASGTGFRAGERWKRVFTGISSQQSQGRSILCLVILRMTNDVGFFSDWWWQSLRLSPPPCPRPGGDESFFRRSPGIGSRRVSIDREFPENPAERETFREPPREIPGSTPDTGGRRDPRTVIYHLFSHHSRIYPIYKKHLYPVIQPPFRPKKRDGIYIWGLFSCILE